MTKVLVAMSGGVDSSVTAYLLAKQGYECIGATMRLCGGFDELRGCDSKAVKDAKDVCKSLGIPHHAIDLSAQFKEHVIDYFADAYRSGATPNPCVECNRHIKFGALLSEAVRLGADYIATGHYARVEHNPETGHYLLKKARDRSKDQSYVLYTLTCRQLSRVLLPLGGLTKTAIRSLAAKQGFICADKPDSQDICFIPDGDYAGFIERYTGRAEKPGDFIDMQGNVLGQHRGLIRYTIGQRKGLGLAVLNPMYVHSKDALRNTVTVCEAEDLFSNTLEAVDFNWLVQPPPDGTQLRATAKTRYSAAEAAATATADESSGKVFITFDKPQRALTRGQSVVLYDGEVVLGGGIIAR